MLKHIDLNSDMGERENAEGLALDAELMPFLTSVNIACGAHAGSPTLMRHTARLAADHGVAIGAHPSFPDRERFGRMPLPLAPDEIESLVTAQISTLSQVIGPDRLTITHVKPHGALYNMAAKDHSIAQAIVRSIQRFDSKLLLYALAGSVLVHAAQSAGLTVIQEAFADVSESWEFLEEVGSETWAEMMNDVLQILSSEVYRYGGEIGQFREDGLVALFGATVAHENDPERAVLRSEVAELGRQMRNLDARLDFTEQLLGGALPLAPPPARLPEKPPADEQADDDARSGAAS